MRLAELWVPTSSFGLHAIRLIFLSYNKRSARSRTPQPWITGNPSGDPVDGRTGPGADNVGPPSPVPVELVVDVDHQKPESVEVAEYYVVAESAHRRGQPHRASRVTVCAQSHRALLHLWIRDDGVGGANCAKGSELTGLRDRVEALAARWTSTITPDV
jgi:hypothetical protein